MRERKKAGNKITFIRDAVFGDINVSDTAKGLIGDPHMQRLAQIKQLGFVSLVYPGANHTRFEHSLGTMELTRQIALQTCCRGIEELECAGLLHDIGHAAFSHSSDSLLKKYLKTTHEKVGAEIIRKTTIRDRLSGAGLSVKRVLEYFSGRGKGAIVTGTLGSDRLDYLIRDAHYTGTTYGMIDYASIKNRMTLLNDHPAIYEKGVFSAEYMLVGRYSMFESVYLHHTSLIAAGMYENAVSSAIDAGELSADELRGFTDWEMLSRLTGGGSSSGLATRLVERNLFKRAYHGRLEGSIKMAELEGELGRLGLGEGDYIAKVIDMKGGSDDIDVVDRDGRFVGRLTKISPLVGKLTSILSSKRELLVGCDGRNVEKVGRAVRRLL